MRPLCCRLFVILKYWVLLTLATTAYAGEQAEQAVAEVKKLISSGQIPQGTVLRLVAKQGNIANFLGQDHQLKQLWESRTGTLIDVHTMPQIASLNFIRESDKVDLTIARNREYADLFQQSLIEDLTPFYTRFYGADYTDSDLVLPRLQAEFSGKKVAVPADGDMAILYLRGDLLADNNNKERYSTQYGQTLKIPETWEEYQQQVEFFHNPESDFYGSLEQRDQASGWMFWLVRYTSQSMPNQLLFDKDMNPLVNSPEGISATQSYMATLKFSPEGILDSKSNYTFTLPRFLNGKGYSTISTLAAAKILNLPHSKVKDKYIAVPIPGNLSDKQINRRTTLIYGNNLVVPKEASNKDLAFLFAMWLTDPDISLRALQAKGGFSDPYRFSHFSAPEMQAIYSEDVLKTVMSDLPNTVPAGTGLPGDTEYISLLNEQIYLAAKGDKTAAEAMATVDSGWRMITQKYGVENQKKIWADVRQGYPGQNEE